jgi:hypothetical protein
MKTILGAHLSGCLFLHLPQLVVAVELLQLLHEVALLLGHVRSHLGCKTQDMRLSLTVTRVFLLKVCQGSKTIQDE